MKVLPNDPEDEDEDADDILPHNFNPKEFHGMFGLGGYV